MKPWILSRREDASLTARHESAWVFAAWPPGLGQAGLRWHDGAMWFYRDHRAEGEKVPHRSGPGCWWGSLPSEIEGPAGAPGEFVITETPLGQGPDWGRYGTPGSWRVVLPLFGPHGGGWRDGWLAVLRPDGRHAALVPPGPPVDLSLDPGRLGEELAEEAVPEPPRTEETLRHSYVSFWRWRFAPPLHRYTVRGEALDEVGAAALLLLRQAFPSSALTLDLVTKDPRAKLLMRALGIDGPSDVAIAEPPGEVISLEELQRPLAPAHREAVITSLDALSGVLRPFRRAPN